MSLINELCEDEKLHAQIASLELIPSGGGRYEITVNDQLLYSKAATGRHAEPGEIYNLIKAKIV